MENMMKDAKCKKCGKPFKPTMMNTWRCLPCFKKGLKKVINTPHKELLKAQAKEVLK